MDAAMWTDFKNSAALKVKTFGKHIMLAHENHKPKFESELLSTEVDLSYDDVIWDTKCEVEDNQNKAVTDMINWLGKMVRKVRERAQENGKFIQGIFGLLKEMTEEIKRQNEYNDVTFVKTDDTEKLKKEMKEEMDTKTEALEEKLDEARQRGLKGNFIVSSPSLPGKPGKDPKYPFPRLEATQEDRSRKESDEMYCLRMIKAKTGIEISRNDIRACHRLPIRGEGRRGEERGERSSSYSFVVSFLDRKAGSKWDMLSQCVRFGKCDGGGSMVKECNVFINYQLTQGRAKLAKACRQARFTKKVSRDRVDANGKIQVKFGQDWVEIKSEKELEEAIRQEEQARPNYRQQGAIIRQPRY